MPVSLAGEHITVLRMIDNVLQHVGIVEEFMLVNKRFVHEMNIVVQTAPVIEQCFDGDGGVGEAGEIFGNGIMDIQFSVLPELERAHGGECLGNGRKMKSRMGRDRVPPMQRIAKTLVFFEEDDTILGDQDAAIEAAGEHRLEEMRGEGRIVLDLGPREFRHGDRRRL